MRFHGRNRHTWFKRGITVEERFSYLYKPEELAEWVPKIRDLAAQTQQVHVLMNNCYHDYAVRNARDMARLLEGQLLAPELSRQLSRSGFQTGSVSDTEPVWRI